MKQMVAGLAMLGLLASCSTQTLNAGVRWDPEGFAKEETLDFLTVGPDEGEHWSRVWLVVVDGDVYIRLGSRAAERMTKNTAAPYVRVRVAGQEFDFVSVNPVPDMKGAVETAMAEKYWSDVLVRHFDHPLTLRLTRAE
jgi:hypothetical protein